MCHKIKRLNITAFEYPPFEYCVMKWAIQRKWCCYKWSNCCLKEKPVCKGFCKLKQSLFMEHHFYLKSTTKRQIIQAIQINKAWEFGKHFLENEWSLGLKKKKLKCVLLMMKHMLSNKNEFYKTCIQKVSLLCKLPCELRNANMLEPGPTKHTSNGLPKALLRSVVILINVVLGIPYHHLVSKPVFQNY